MLNIFLNMILAVLSVLMVFLNCYTIFILIPKLLKLLRFKISNVMKLIFGFGLMSPYWILHFGENFFKGSIKVSKVLNWHLFLFQWFNLFFLILCECGIALVIAISFHVTIKFIFKYLF